MSYSRLLMGVSAAVLAAFGLAGSFLPHETLGRLGAAPSAPLVLLLQAFGAVCLGFALLDWMSRHATLGGIYGRPLVVGNLLHFASAALAFFKLMLRNPELRTLWPLGLVYALLALGFGVVLFRQPSTASTASGA
jgi:hypothetical protein